MRKGLRSQFSNISLMAHGLSGMIYRATYRTSATTVAIKVLKHQSTTVQHYFFNEHQLLQQIKAAGGHPHLAELIYSQMSKQPWCIATRYIGSLSPTEVYQQYNPALVAQIIEQIATALDYLHYKHPHQPVIHRDVKPENILVDRQTGNATLIDLGIARSSTMRFMHEEMLGTPQYMAPEHHQAAEVPASDQWSLALVTIYYLSGTALLAENGHNHTDRTALHTQIQARFRDNASLCHVLERALQYDPEARFANCSLFASALRTALDQGGTRLNLFPWKPQHPISYRASALLVIMAGIALFALYAFQIVFNY